MVVGMRRALGTLLVVLALACGDDEPSASRAPAGGGNTGGGTTAGRPTPTPDDDAGSDGPDTTDAGSGVEQLRIECANVDDVNFIGEDMPTRERVNAVVDPEDMVLGRVVTTWDPDCGAPALLVKLSDGTCPDGDGHEITFRLSVDDIEDGLILAGQNFIQPEGGGIEVRYVRPDDLTPSGEWGNCAGASGTIDLIGGLELRRRTNLEARFLLELTDCDGSGDDPQPVTGDFNARIQRSLEDVCPEG